MGCHASRVRTHSHYIFSGFVLYCLVLFSRDLSKEDVLVRNDYFSLKRSIFVNFCRYEISLFYLKLFLKTKKAIRLLKENHDFWFFEVKHREETMPNKQSQNQKMGYQIDEMT